MAKTRKGFFSRLFGSAEPTQKRSSTSVIPGWLARIGELTSSGEHVSNKNSLAINAVYNSAKIIGESISIFEFNTFEVDGNKRTRVETDASQLLGVSPNPDHGITAADLWKSVGVHLATAGNSYWYIERNGGGRPIALHPILPDHMDVRLDEDNEVIYIYYESNSKNIKSVYKPDEILHFKNSSWDGLKGMSPIREQRETLGLAKKQQKYAGSAYGNKPPGYITTDQTLSPEQLKQVSEFWQNQSNSNGVQGKGVTPVLGFGMEFKSIGISPADLEYINTANLTEDQIYNMYRIPPPIRGDFERATFANAEQSELIFLKNTMLPYIVSFQQEIDLKLLPIRNRTAKKKIKSDFGMNSILKADFASRTEGYTRLVERGIMNSNEVRAIEGLNPREDGDTYYVMQNMIPVDLQREQLNNNNNGQD